MVTLVSLRLIHGVDGANRSLLPVASQWHTADAQYYKTQRKRREKKNIATKQQEQQSQLNPFSTAYTLKMVTLSTGVWTN